MDLDSRAEQELVKAKIAECIEFGDLHGVLDIKRRLVQYIPPKTKKGPLVELLRRADRANGLLVRRGQHGPDKYILARNDGHRAGGVYVDSLRFFLSIADRSDCYAMTDNVSDEEFELALDKAREQNNLTRVNVASLCSGKDRRDPSKSQDRPEVLRRRHRHSPTRIIEQAINTLEGVIIGLQILQPEDYDTLGWEDAERWVGSLNRSIRELNTLRKGLQNVRSE